METSPMDRIAHDLVLLAIDPTRGTVRRSLFLRYGLMGAELVRLTAQGWLDVRDGRIVALRAGPASDVHLDTALASIVTARRPPKAVAWMGRPRRQIVGDYLNVLAAAGEVSSSGSGRKTRWRITDPAAAASARERLDQAALGPAESSMADVTLAQAAYAGLAHAAQLDQVLYRGRGSRAIRKRCAQLGRGRLSGGVQGGLEQPGLGPHASIPGATAVDAAVQAAVAAAIRASAAAASSAS